MIYYNEYIIAFLMTKELYWIWEITKHYHHFLRYESKGITALESKVICDYPPILTKGTNPFLGKLDKSNEKAKPHEIEFL